VLLLPPDHRATSRAGLKVDPHEGTPSDLRRSRKRFGLRDGMRRSLMQGDERAALRLVAIVVILLLHRDSYPSTRTGTGSSLLQNDAAAGRTAPRTSR